MSAAAELDVAQLFVGREPEPLARLAAEVVCDACGAIDRLNETLTPQRQVVDIRSPEHETRRNKGEAHGVRMICVVSAFDEQVCLRRHAECSKRRI